MSAPEMYPPSPPTRQGSGSCWKWGGIACAGCGCVVVLAFVAFLAVVASRPDVRKAYSRIMTTAQEAEQAIKRMQKLGEAIGKFAEDNGRYPDKLADLAPRYVAAEMLRVSDSPEAKQFTYHKPPPDAEGSFRMLEVDIPNPVMPTQAPPIRYYWTKAGKLETPSAFQIETEPSPHQRERGSASEPDGK